jgi:transposase
MCVCAHTYDETFDEKNVLKFQKLRREKEQTRKSNFKSSKSLRRLRLLRANHDTIFFLSKLLMNY